MMIGRKAKEGRAAAHGLMAKTLVYDILFASMFGSSLAAMSPEGAEHAKAEIKERLKIAAEAASDPEFRAAFEASALYMMTLIDTSEADARKR